ncbi:hypothetical protein LTS18_001893 [Coniosporium uncinatum]|uniref:Uncharacterized protein n=1 Tax=Coniosporium uncinatum TaxID=93489 RepID=A0ACC3D7S7_9PEZI|nr:hypothetical protein LTS18_001893 [Coniosporium uncinatum]
MAAQDSPAFVQGDFSEPMANHGHMSEDYELEDSNTSVSSYARTMHQHTKQQLAMATKSARRRSGDQAPDLSLETSNTGSISSVSSNESV